MVGVAYHAHVVPDYGLFLNWAPACQVFGCGVDAIVAHGGEGVSAAEEEALDGVGGFTANCCFVKVDALGGVGRKVREEEVEVGLECAVWLVFRRVCARMGTVNWSCFGWKD